MCRSILRDFLWQQNWTRIHDDPDLPFMVRLHPQVFLSVSLAARPAPQLTLFWLSLGFWRLTQSTQRTPIDLKDKWRVLSKKLPPEEMTREDSDGAKGTHSGESRRHPKSINLPLFWGPFLRCAPP